MKMKCAAIFFISFICLARNEGEKLNVKPGLYPLNVVNFYLAVKTTQKHEQSRLPVILDTWFMFAKQQTWFFTDVGDTIEFESMQNYTNGHMVVTHCGKSHDLLDLCCKTNHELNRKLDQKEQEHVKWLCLFDDDNYVNVPNLLVELQKFDYNQEWYLGQERDRLGPSRKRFSYAPLGAGVCLSRPVVIRMQPLIRDSGFARLCEKIQRPDDVSLGYLLEIKLGIQLKNSPMFRSHSESLMDLPEDALKRIVTTGHNFYSNHQNKKIPGFPENLDPSRFYSLHCFLGYCSKALREWYQRKLISGRRDPDGPNVFIPASIPTFYLETDIEVTVLQYQHHLNDIQKELEAKFKTTKGIPSSHDIYGEMNTDFAKYHKQQREYQRIDRNISLKHPTMGIMYEGEIQR